MRTRLTRKPNIPIARTTDSISTEIDEGFSELMDREMSLRFPQNDALLNKAKSADSESDLLEEFRKMLCEI